MLFHKTRVPGSRPSASFSDLTGRLAILLTVLLTLVAAGCSAPGTNAPGGAASDAAVADPYQAHGAAKLITSPNDPRQYELLTLPNRLRVLLISDPAADKAAASMVVARGSLHEPPETAGLAHFLEHMLFIGTAKYPDVDDYQQFIAQHGGSSNAYTAPDHTNYFFDIKPEQFQPAMDRFAQFFIAPLFASDYVDREKNAVNSEYQLQTKDAGWRGYAVSKLALNPEHPGSRFTIGSLDTLGDDVRDQLVSWFRDNYSADQMFLVALSNEPLDAMDDWIKPMFADVPDRDVGPPADLPPAYTDRDLPATLSRETLKDSYGLEVQFRVPALAPHFRSKPGLYITNLLGHEGEGSLHQLLKSSGWIQNLTAAADDLDPNTGLITLSMKLTPLGAEQVPLITRAVFDYVALLRERGADRALFEEQAALLRLAFQFQESISPSRLVTALGPRFLHTPAAHVTDAAYLMDRFDADLIERYLDYLTEDNLLVEISGPTMDTDAVEPWFQVPYRLTKGAFPIAEAAPTESLALPAPNPFLPERIDLVAGARDPIPTRVVEQPGITLWQAVDTEFGTPKATLSLTLGIPGGINTAKDLVLARLYSALVVDALDDYAYPAYLAGLSYQLSPNASGFELRLAGYDDKQVRLLETVLTTFAELAPDPERFAVYRDDLERSWKNFRTEKPFTQTLTALANLVQSGSFPPAELAAVASAVTVADLNSWLAANRQQITVQGLMHGNIRAGRAEQIAKTLASTLKLKAGQLYRPEIFTPTVASRLNVPVDHPDASMILYLQDTESTIEARAASALVTHLLRQPYFTELRTKDQLGYVVGVSNRTFLDRGGVAFIVQSPVADPKRLVERTYEFLDEQVGVLGAMATDEFIAYRNGLIADLLESPKNLGERTSQFWSDLRLEHLNFDSRETLASAIGQIEQASAVESVKALRAALPQRQLVVYNLGKFDQAPESGTALNSLNALNPQAARSPAADPAVGAGSARGDNARDPRS